jgi:hypothetical protein
MCDNDTTFEVEAFTGRALGIGQSLWINDFHVFIEKKDGVGG